jgi:hypothetical protein
MELRKFVACTAYAATFMLATGCADGTGQALTPTLPTVDTATVNADGTRLKASAPQPLSPVSAIRVASLTPQLVLENGTSTFAPSAGLSYVFEVYELDGSSQISVAKSDPIPAGGSRTTWDVPADALKMNKTYAWLARATYSNVQGSTSDVVSFRTPVPAPPKDSNTPGPIFCAGSTGRDIIACVSDAFPERLVKTNVGDFSDERRFANMEFLRDVIIATGKCKGLNLGRNNKRGGPEISRDFIVYRSNIGKNGRDRGVDIASGYDDTKTTLKLTWQLFDGDRNWGHPFYNDYGPVDCTGLN